ncbi:MAG: hypothetical protein KGJ06_06800 [Pseudomonadota bacterium]|nr:hypothetical protein [Pseudomonadota bacterium]
MKHIKEIDDNRKVFEILVADGNREPLQLYSGGYNTSISPEGELKWQYKSTSPTGDVEWKSLKDEDPEITEKRNQFLLALKDYLLRELPKQGIDTKYPYDGYDGTSVDVRETDIRIPNKARNSVETVLEKLTREPELAAYIAAKQDKKTLAFKSVLDANIGRIMDSLDDKISISLKAKNPHDAIRNLVVGVIGDISSARENAGARI